MFEYYQLFYSQLFLKIEGSYLFTGLVNANINNLKLKASRGKQNYHNKQYFKLSLDNASFVSQIISV